MPRAAEHQRDLIQKALDECGRTADAIPDNAEPVAELLFDDGLRSCIN